MEDDISKAELDGTQDMLSTLKRASLEWRNKYNIACLRLDSIYNDAIHDSMDAISVEHDPVHDSSLCGSCWFRSKLRPLLRLDHPPYVPMRERMMHRFDELKYLANFMPNENQDAYLSGLGDARIVVEDLLDDRL